jgi:putative ABC transport system permease protein
LTKERTVAKELRVAGFCDEAIGTQAYMPRSQLESLLRSDLDLPGNAITSILLIVDPTRQGIVRSHLKELPHNASVTSSATIRSMISTMVQSSSRFILIMQIFGFVLAFATIFNMVTMNVLERRAEVATLRTIGVSRSSIAAMVAAENLLVALIGISVGLPISKAFVKAFWQAAQTEQQQDLFTFQVVVLPDTYAQAVLAILLVALISMPPSVRALNRMDLARAVKERST